MAPMPGVRREKTRRRRHRQAQVPPLREVSASLPPTSEKTPWTLLAAEQ